MCMEDVRMGRETWGQYQSVAIGTTAVQLWGHADKRVRVVLFGPRSGIATVAPTPNPTIGQGILISASDQPIILTIEDYGSILTNAWFAITDIGTSIFDFTEGLLDRK